MSAYDTRKYDTAALSSVFQVSLGTVNNWLGRRRDTGDYVAKKACGPTPKVSTSAFKAYMEVPDNNFKTQEEIGTDLGVSAMTVSNLMRAIGYTRKKRLAPTKKQMT